MSEALDGVAAARSRRSGGREARRALRSAPLADDVRPIRSGLEGGRYQPLSQADQERIHEGVLTILETVGFANGIPSCIEACTKAGAVYGDDGRLRFPRRLVEETIRTAARHFTLHAQDPKHDMVVQGRRVHYGTAGAAVHVVDIEKREYRESLLQDIYDAARIVDVMDNIHFFQRPMVARDMVDPADLDLNTLYACVTGTSKHVGTSFTVAENVGPALEMLYAIAGGEENFRARPFVSNSNCFVVPPMKFAEDACGVLEACVKGGIPILLLSAGQAGATAPAHHEKRIPPCPPPPRVTAAQLSAPCTAPATPSFSPTPGTPVRRSSLPPSAPRPSPPPPPCGAARRRRQGGGRVRRPDAPPRPARAPRRPRVSCGSHGSGATG